jgi:hydrogenase expression/formation protein HypC
MCLAIPMQIDSIDGYTARCQAKGVWRDVSLFMLQDEMPGIGDYVMVHVGYAIQTVTEADANSTWELLDQVADEISA